LDLPYIFFSKSVYMCCQLLVDGNVSPYKTGKLNYFEVNMQIVIKIKLTILNL
jgi:hypothetical protein